MWWLKIEMSGGNCMLHLPSLVAEPVQQQRFYCDTCNQYFRRAQDITRHRCDNIRSRCTAGTGIAGISKGTSTTKFQVASVIDFVYYFAERHHHGMAVFDQVKSSHVCVYMCLHLCVCLFMCVCLHLCVCTRVRAYVCIRMYVCTCVCMCVHLCMCAL